MHICFIIFCYYVINIYCYHHFICNHPSYSLITAGTNPIVDNHPIRDINPKDFNCPTVDIDYPTVDIDYPTVDIGYLTTEGINSEGIIS
jgi:hypothetical protein